MSKKSKLGVSLMLGVIWFSLGFAVSTSSCWKSQLGGTEHLNTHHRVNLGVSDYLAFSSDSGTGSYQSCVLNKEMAGLNDEQKKVLKNLYKVGRKIVHTSSHIVYLSKCCEICVCWRTLFKEREVK